MNLGYADSHYYASTVPLNLITAPTGNVSLNGHKVFGLADATQDTDALNRQTADGRYYRQTNTLD